MKKSLITLIGLIYLVSHGGNSLLLENKIIKPCLHLKEANDTARGLWVKFLLIRGTQGKPDKLRLWDRGELEKILAKVTAAHDYAKCLEGGVMEQEVKRKDSI